MNKTKKPLSLDGFKKSIRDTIMASRGRSHLTALKPMTVDDEVMDKLTMEIICQMYEGQISKRNVADTVSRLGRAVEQFARIKSDDIGTSGIRGAAILNIFIEDYELFKIEERFVRSEYDRVAKKNIQIRMNFPVPWKRNREWNEFCSMFDETKRTFPSKNIIDDWDSYLHSSGVRIVSKLDKRELEAFSPIKQPLCFNTLNKLQRSPWKLNEQVVELFKKMDNLKEKDIHKIMVVEDDGGKTKHLSMLPAHRVSGDTNRDKQRKKSLLNEQRIIREIVNEMGSDTFYHKYNFDFRGRVYCLTPYLQVQGSDLARGMLKHSHGTPLGDYGLFHLKIFIANTCGQDKLSLNKRIKWVDDHFDDFIRFAKDPLDTHNEWIKIGSDEPTQFIACCFELLKLHQHRAQGGKDREFVSDIFIYIDASNNGSQHFSAISRDRDLAKEVNVTYDVDENGDQILGDVYMKMAEILVSEYQEAVQKVYDLWGKDVADDQYQMYLDALAAHKANVERHRKLDKSKQNWDKVKAARRSSLAKVKLDIEELSRMFWLDEMTRSDGSVNWSFARKLCKRPTMVFGYSGKRDSMFTSITEDHVDYLVIPDMRLANKLSGRIYSVIHQNMKGVSDIMTLIHNFAGMFERKFDKDTGEMIHDELDVHLVNPINQFPIFQRYTEPDKVLIKPFIQGKRISITLQDFKNTFRKDNKHKSALSPNIIHSLDGSHLQLVLRDAKFDVSVIHDSFGCLAGNMEDLHGIVRKTFVEIYTDRNPLAEIFSQAPDHIDQVEITTLISRIPQGSLNVNDILTAEFAFR